MVQLDSINYVDEYEGGLLPSAASSLWTFNFYSEDLSVRSCQCSGEEIFAPSRSTIVPTSTVALPRFVTAQLSSLRKNPLCPRRRSDPQAEDTYEIVETREDVHSADSDFFYAVIMKPFESLDDEFNVGQRKRRWSISPPPNLLRLIEPARQVRP